MQDTYEPKPPQAPWPVFVIGFLMLLLFLAGTQFLLQSPGPAPEEDAGRSAERAKAYADLQAEDARKLGEFAWADRAKGTVQVPISQAMQLAAARLANSPPRPFSAEDPPSMEAAPSAPDTSATTPAAGDSNTP
jgi:hypothetical protein